MGQSEQANLFLSPAFLRLILGIFGGERIIVELTTVGSLAVGLR